MDALAEACEEVARFHSRARKVSILASYLRTLGKADRARAVRFLSTGRMFAGDAKLSAGTAILREAAMAASGWDETVAAACFQAAGDSGETISLLVAGRTGENPLSLAEAEVLYARLSKARGAAKVELLRDCFTRFRPLTLRYFVRGISGNLRIGLEAGMVAEAAGDPRDEVRLFHPANLIPTEPIESIGLLPDPVNYWLEDKYDGLRAQVHCDARKVVVFARSSDDVTRAVPQICEAFRRIPGSALLDGEILAWRDGRPLPFAALEQRLERKPATPSMLAAVPLIFLASDLLIRDGVILTGLPIEDRRRRLEELGVAVTPQKSAANLDSELEAAYDRGSEGLVFKRRGSLYEPGAWLEWKRPFATLDVVVTAAAQGHVLSEYTFGVRSADGFVNVGKASCGLNEIHELTRVLRSLVGERFSDVLLVKPGVVLEIAFDGVQKSPRHKSGYALRFPRIIRWRRDKRPEEADNIDTVRALYEASFQR